MKGILSVLGSFKRRPLKPDIPEDVLGSIILCCDYLDNHPTAHNIYSACKDIADVESAAKRISDSRMTAEFLSSEPRPQVVANAISAVLHKYSPIFTYDKSSKLLLPDADVKLILQELPQHTRQFCVSFFRHLCRNLKDWGSTVTDITSALDTAFIDVASSHDAGIADEALRQRVFTRIMLNYESLFAFAADDEHTAIASVQDRSVKVIFPTSEGDRVLNHEELTSALSIFGGISNVGWKEKFAVVLFEDIGAVTTCLRDYEDILPDDYRVKPMGVPVSQRVPSPPPESNVRCGSPDPTDAVPPSAADMECSLRDAASAFQHVSSSTDSADGDRGDEVGFLSGSHEVSSIHGDRNSTAVQLADFSSVDSGSDLISFEPRTDSRGTQEVEGDIPDASDLGHGVESPPPKSSPHVPSSASSGWRAAAPRPPDRDAQEHSARCDGSVGDDDALESFSECSIVTEEAPAISASSAAVSMKRSRVVRVRESGEWGSGSGDDVQGICPPPENSVYSANEDSAYSAHENSASHVQGKSSNSLQELNDDILQNKIAGTAHERKNDSMEAQTADLVQNKSTGPAHERMEDSVQNMRSDSSSIDVMQVPIASPLSAKGEDVVTTSVPPRTRGGGAKSISAGPTCKESTFIGPRGMKDKETQNLHAVGEDQKRRLVSAVCPARNVGETVPEAEWMHHRIRILEAETRARREQHEADANMVRRNEEVWVAEVTALRVQLSEAAIRVEEERERCRRMASFLAEKDAEINALTAEKDALIQSIDNAKATAEREALSTVLAQQRLIKLLEKQRNSAVEKCRLLQSEVKDLRAAHAKAVGDMVDGYEHLPAGEGIETDKAVKVELPQSLPDGVRCENNIEDAEANRNSPTTPPAVVAEKEGNYDTATASPQGAVEIECTEEGEFSDDPLLRKVQMLREAAKSQIESYLERRSERNRTSIMSKPVRCRDEDQEKEKEGGKRHIEFEESLKVQQQLSSRLADNLHRTRNEIGALREENPKGICPSDVARITNSRRSGPVKPSLKSSQYEMRSSPGSRPQATIPSVGMHGGKQFVDVGPSYGHLIPRSIRKPTTVPLMGYDRRPKGNAEYMHSRNQLFGTGRDIRQRPYNTHVE